MLTFSHWVESELEESVRDELGPAGAAMMEYASILVRGGCPDNRGWVGGDVRILD